MVLWQSFAKHYGGGGCVGEGEGGTKDQGKKSSISPLYIGRPRGGGAGPRRSNLLGGCGQGEESLLPKAPRRCLPLLGLFLLETLGAGLLRLVPLSHVGQGAPPTAHVAPRDRWPHPVDPWDPSGGPGTIPMTPKLVPMPETGLPIYKSLPPDHSGTPRDVRDLIRDSEQHSGYCIYISLQP